MSWIRDIRTFPNGSRRWLYEQMQQSLANYAMLESVEPGITGKDIWNAGIRVAEQAGYRDYVNHVYFGHTTGIATSVRPVVAQGESKEIWPNSFLNIEPGIFVPGVGSASIENALWVTEDGAESVNKFRIDLHVKDE
jgi:Xaa-Pro aminopeptidase